MRNQKYSTVIIDGVDYWEYFRFPMLLQKSLDESLDFATIELHGMRRKEPFKPFTPVTVGEGSIALSYIVASDEVTEIFGQGRYKHIVTVMEKTKETERIMCGAKAFTNPLVRDYTDGQTRASYYYLRKPDVSFAGFKYEWLVNKSDYFKDGTFVSPVIATDPFVFYPFKTATGINVNQSKSLTWTIYYSASGYPLQLKSKVEEGANSYIVEFELSGDAVLVETKSSLPSASFSLDLTEGEGIYTVVVGSFDDTDSTSIDQDYLMFDVYTVNSAAEKHVYTIESVVNQLLDTSETIRKGLDYIRYRLRYKSDEQRKRFKQSAPEFRFSNGRSLWENLREVGQFVHAIPRAVHDLTDGLDYIEFDDLGGTEYANLAKGDRYGGGASLSVGDYTAGLESLAVNLINADDIGDGSVTEPFDNGWVSLRSATEDARIREDKGIIKTNFPIAKLLKVELGSFTVNGKTYAGGDITPYVFSKPEYDVLSSFSGAYPKSKTYALYYTPDSPNIEGLWYKAQDASTNMFNALESYSITNVIKSCVCVPTGFLQDLDYKNLIFRVTYIPAVTARVRQHNPVYDGAFPAILAHNQSANKLSAKAFGENLRGQLAMMSKADEVVQYRFRRVEDMPEVGTLYDDDRYISSITARVYHDFVLAQLNLSAGYNELGARVEINNAIRQFEIPASEDRYTNLEEFCIVGKKMDDDPYTALTAAMKAEVMRAFVAQTASADVSLALVETRDDDGNAITTTPVALPVVSLAIGTSLYFGWRFESNFAAGSKSSAGGLAYRAQEYVPYGDQFYAHANTVGFKLLTGSSAIQPNTLQMAHDLPESKWIAPGTALVDTGNYPILWHKDSADAGCLAYQLHYITNDGLIIGDGLAHFCAAVRKNRTLGRAKIYFYAHRINQLTGTTETDDALYSFDVVANVSRQCIESVTPPPGARSWAIIKDGMFMLGKNSGEFEEIYFSFRRKRT